MAKSHTKSKVQEIEELEHKPDEVNKATELKLAQRDLAITEIHWRSNRSKLELVQQQVAQKEAQANVQASDSWNGDLTADSQNPWPLLTSGLSRQPSISSSLRAK